MINPMMHECAIDLLELEMSVSNAIDLISSEVANHHKRVAYIAWGIASEMGLSAESRHTLMLAGLLHDVGALTLQERVQVLRWDSDDPHTHAEVAYLLLRKFRHFREVAEVVRFHHVQWERGSGQLFRGARVPLESHILHLADRIDALVDRRRPVLSQAEGITALVCRESGSRFVPEMVEAFTELASKEFFWLDIVSPSLERVLMHGARNQNVELDWDDLQDFAELLAQIIDFRSRFTATHSSGVSAVAAMLAHLMGFSETECEKMKVAGYLHDVGKLAIPPEVLEKPARLSEDEFRTIKSHAYHTYRILEPIAGLEDVLTWAALHHERLDGNGYPARRPGHKVPLGARIMAVADVFTALSERRPYRKAAASDEVVQLLQRMVRERALDASVVGVVMEHFDDLDRHRQCAQERAAAEYEEFRQALRQWPSPLAS